MYYYRAGLWFCLITSLPYLISFLGIFNYYYDYVLAAIYEDNSSNVYDFIVGKSKYINYLQVIFIKDICNI